MPTDVVMPQMGESIFEGTITKWLKKAGDTVQKDEPLFEISTDKVDAEIPSPVAGILTEIKIGEGATVQINTVVAVVAEASEAISPAFPASAPAGTDVVMPQMGESIFEGTITRWLKKAGDTVQKDEPLFEISTDKVDAEIPSPVAGILTEIRVGEGATVQINAVVAVIGGSSSSADATGSSSPEPVTASETPVPAAASPTAQAAQPEPPPATSGTPPRTSPLVRRIAKENNHDLARVAASIPGSGAGGRITKDDILRYLSQPRPAAATPPPASARTAAPAPPASTLPGQVVPLSRMRSIIAQRMVDSVAIAPHVYSVYKIDMTRIARLRQLERARFEKTHGIKLTFMPFIAAAAIEALRRHPIVNSSLIDGSIHYHANVHLGIAVALEWGLIVPVVRQAETLTFVELARTMADLAERARTKKLKPDEASGSTFTLTNSGVFGGEFGTPIINQPESAILAIGGLKKEAVVMSDSEGSDTIAIRSMQSYCLGFDHRLIDGADGGKFLSTIKQVLETWNREIG